MLRVAPVDDDRCVARVHRSHFGQAPLGNLADGLGAATATVDGQQHRHSQPHRDACVEGLRTRVDVGVVAADDDHGVALTGDLVIIANDLTQRGLRTCCRSLRGRRRFRTDYGIRLGRDGFQSRRSTQQRRNEFVVLNYVDTARERADNNRFSTPSSLGKPVDDEPLFRLRGQDTTRSPNLLR